MVCGGTSGPTVEINLPRLFFKQHEIIGSTMGTRDELARLTKFLVQAKIEPVIDSVLPLAEAREGFAKMIAGDVFGKVVFTMS